MNIRLVPKLALMVATLGAVTLLQGCGDDDDRVFAYSPYMPCIPGVTFGIPGVAVGSGAPGGSGQNNSGAPPSAAAAARAAGGGNQVSGGAGGP